jgi:hypothetical protein
MPGARRIASRRGTGENPPMDAQPSARPAAVAGRFYPADPAQLRDEVARLLAGSPCPGAAPKVLVVPHAGYQYSGPIAARAYARLAAAAPRIARVVLLGPSHFVALRGLAAPTVTEWRTSLGAIAIDREALADVADLRQVIAHDQPHAREHSLEVQLPFLQTVLPRFALAPLAVGAVAPAAVAEVLERLWGGDETLVVISTDLSHYLGYDAARERDARTAARIAARATDLVGEDCCGCQPLNGLLALAARRGMSVEQLDLRNSGDTAGDRSRVVGYGSWALGDARA